MIHPETSVVRISPAVGLGVVASRYIPRGTLIWVQDRFDRVIPRAEGVGMDAAHRAILDRYAHRDVDSNWVLCWDAGRLVNHACEPTLRGLGPSAMAARRDLHPGDEVTCDYAECNIEWPLDCDCASSACRGSVHGRDLLRFADRWDEEAYQLSVAARSLPQPLLPFAIEREDLEAWISGSVPIPSFSTQSPLRTGSLQ